MVTSGDWTQIAADLAKVRGYNSVSVVFRRGDTQLAAQTIRLAGAGSGSRVSAGNPARESRSSIVILGAATLDIALDDRFTVSGILYRVTWIRPSRKVATQARAEVVE